MAHIKATFIALVFGLVAAPAIAGSFSFDLPRLDFPAPGTDTSRDCTAVVLPGGTQTCAQTGK